MKSRFEGIGFSLPYEIAMVRPLRQTSLEEREEALKQASYNTELIPQEMVYVDLKTDSGVSSLSTSQLGTIIGAETLEAAVELAPEANQGFTALAKQFQEIFGYPFVIPCVQGRAAERIWMKLNVRNGSVVPGNMLFPSTRYHIESNGGKVIDVISERALDLVSDEPFKGDLDIGKLEATLKDHGREKISCIYAELCVNSCGGHPVSLANLRKVSSVAKQHRVPLFLDASRILENSYLIKQREQGYQSRSILEIVRETCSLADGCTMSALKDFLVPAGGFIATRDEKFFQKAHLQAFLDGVQPSSSTLAALGVSLGQIFHSDGYVASRVQQVEHLWHRLVGREKSIEKGVAVLRPPGGHAVFIDVTNFLPHVSPERYPAEALAAFIYRVSGVRITKGPPLTHEQIARGINLLRLALPARRYLQQHLDDVAEAVLYAFARRSEIRGLRQIEKPGRSKYEPALFAQLEK